MGKRFLAPRFAAYDSNGDPLSGGKLNFYIVSTTTRLDTYSDEGRQSANANPVVADSAGRFGNIFLQPRDYRVILTDSADTEIWDVTVRGDGRNNFNATTAPTATDDIDQGYDEGSLWVDRTNDAAYICLDSSNGAAVWSSLGSQDLNGAELILDVDGDTSFHASSDDQIDIKVGGTDRGAWTNSGLVMASTLDLNGNVLTLDVDGDSTFTADTDDQLDLALQGVDAFIFDGTTASIVNGLTFEASAAAADVKINAQGSDTNISIDHVPKGNGVVKSGGKPIGATAIICDEKAQNTGGGTFTSGADRTRELNKEISDPDALVTISSNQFTISAAGKYLIEWWAPAYQVNRHLSKLYDITGTAELTTGKSAYGAAAAATQTESIGAYIHTITAANTYEIRHVCETTFATQGFGVETNLGVERYTMVKIRKIG